MALGCNTGDKPEDSFVCRHLWRYRAYTLGYRRLTCFVGYTTLLPSAGGVLQTCGSRPSGGLYRTSIRYSFAYLMTFAPRGGDHILSSCRWIDQAYILWPIHLSHGPCDPFSRRNGNRGLQWTTGPFPRCLSTPGRDKCLSWWKHAIAS